MTFRNPACPHLRRLISPYDHGLKHDGRVVHANTNAKVARDLNSRGWVPGLTNAAMQRHFAGRATVYFTADGRIRTPEVLLMIDVDCHRTGTLGAAVAFAEHLREDHFPGLYFEPSTHGNGVHAYLILDTRGFGDERTHSLFGMLDRAIKGIHADWQARNPELIVEMVEVKGHPPRIDWGRDGKVTDYTSGQLAKLPREVPRRWDEFRQTAKIDDRRVSDLYSRWKVERSPRKETKDVVEAATKSVRPRSGSITGHVVAQDALDRFDAYRGLARRLLPEPLRTSGREVATAEDLAILLIILEACTLRMNSDGSMPTARIIKNWDVLRDNGEVTRPFNPKRYSALRNFLSRERLLDWEDESYLPSQMCDEGKGRAARWRASERLMEMILEAREGVEIVGEYGEDRDREKEEYLYGDSHVLSLLKTLEVEAIQGNMSSLSEELTSREDEEGHFGGSYPRWLRELTLGNFPRPVLRVSSSGQRMAA
jgi:hypothetical protein